MNLFWPLHAAASLWRERKTQRSPQWRSLERHFLVANPECAACGGWVLLQVHHVVPVSVDPERELKWSNLVALCMGPRLCHFVLGHHSNWHDYNPDVLRDAALARRKRRRP